MYIHCLLCTKNHYAFCADKSLNRLNKSKMHKNSLKSLLNITLSNYSLYDNITNICIPRTDFCATLQLIEYEIDVSGKESHNALINYLGMISEVILHS